MLPHLPLSRETHCSIKDCVAPPECVDLVNGLHQPLLAVVFLEGEHTKEVGLQHLMWRDMGEIDSCFLELVACSVDVVQAHQGSGYQVGRKRCREGKRARDTPGILWKLPIKKIGMDEDGELCCLGVLLSQFQSRNTGVGRDCLFEFLQTLNWPSK